MTAMPIEFAAIAQPTPSDLALSGSWTARGIGAIQHQLESVHVQSEKEAIADGSLIKALDTAGAWVLQKLLLRLQGEGIKINVRDAATKIPFCEIESLSGINTRPCT